MINTPFQTPGSTADLTAHLMLRLATSFDLAGMVDGIGFVLRVSCNLPESSECEWCVVRYFEEDPWVHATNPLKLAERPELHPAILAQPDSAPSGVLCWVPWTPLGWVCEGYSPMQIEDTQGALLLAHRIADGMLIVEDRVQACLDASAPEESV